MDTPLWLQSLFSQGTSTFYNDTDSSTWQLKILIVESKALFGGNFCRHRFRVRIISDDDSSGTIIRGSHLEKEFISPSLLIVPMDDGSRICHGITMRKRPSLARIATRLLEKKKKFASRDSLVLEVLLSGTRLVVRYILNGLLIKFVGL